MARQAVTFISNYPKHEILRRAKREIPVPDGSGGWITSVERVAYSFEPMPDKETGKLVGVKTVYVGDDKLNTDHSGTLAPGQETGIVRDAPEFLMAHRAFGQDIWLLGHEPGTIYPRPVDWRADVRKASVGLDEEALVNMIAEEKRTHIRPDLITEAEDALELVRNALAEIAAAKQAEETKAAKAKPKATAQA